MGTTQLLVSFYLQVDSCVMCESQVAFEVSRCVQILKGPFTQLLHDQMRPKCRASEEIRNLFY